MKKHLRCVVILVMLSSIVRAQITTAVIRANFGVDADLRSNYFNGLVQAGNDDWYSQVTGGSGQFMIDTTGAAAIVAGYNSNPATRRASFYRTMRFAPFSVVNNRLLIDGVFIRDYHGDDSTVFASGSNKNGQSPVTWSCPVSQGIPDKNDILDMFVHVRRGGPNTYDSLWMFGGIAIENTTGNRYFDFEMYQTDIYYDRPSQQFYGYGPDAGHTSWQFNASGNIITPGDIIFTAEYGSSSLTMIEARIWINRNSMNITPVAFDWTGQFDGDGNGAQFGYAAIRPKSAGPFYTGLQCGNNVWTGPFSLVRVDNTLNTNYIPRQFMEFSVNLTKLGLDPVQLLGGNPCGMPFRRILVKTRSSTSFTAELKDFVGPFDLFLAPRVNIQPDVPFFCGSNGVSTITVTNAVSTSVYNWSTTNGNIVGSTTGTSIQVNQPGTYIVSQQLMTGCSEYARDTVTIWLDEDCEVLDVHDLNFTGKGDGHFAKLKWHIPATDDVSHFIVQRSINGTNFEDIGIVPAGTSPGYHFENSMLNINSRSVYYRLKIVQTNNQVLFSDMIRIEKEYNNTKPMLFPNPITADSRIVMNLGAAQQVSIKMSDVSGKLIKKFSVQSARGYNEIFLPDMKDTSAGSYIIEIHADGMRHVVRGVRSGIK